MGDHCNVDYKDGDVVWVKLGSCWWPGEVIAPEKLPPDVLPSFRKPPIAVVKFFQEDTYEYVKNPNSLYKYNCERKIEFIKKGLDTYRSKHGHIMDKFPEDIIRAETAIGGDIKILTREEFQEQKKESYAGLFGATTKKTQGSVKKGLTSKGQLSASNRIFHQGKGAATKSEYKVHILVQESKSDQFSPVRRESNVSNDKIEDFDKTPTTLVATKVSTPLSSSSGIYSCHACSFTTTRLNVMILHNKTHSATFMPYTPTPIQKKHLITHTKNKNNPSPKSTPPTSRVTKVRKPNNERKRKIIKTPQKKRPAEDIPTSVETKKLKTDEEIKSSLLADWDDGEDEIFDNETHNISTKSPEILVASESSSQPTPNEALSAQIPSLIKEDTNKSIKSVDNPEYPIDSKYEFCEDEDWPEEADAGRKIPRIINPAKRKDETKSLSLDGSDVAKEVAELLSKTTVPDLPPIPESIKYEENFHKPPVVKTPDKTKTETESVESEQSMSCEQVSKPPIFKTKTFFRSRHSRSQDAIGKYVAEQLIAAEKMALVECDLNGSDIASSPEARESPPVEPVRMARLAPKIQLKKNLREKEKNVEQSKLEQSYAVSVEVDASSVSMHEQESPCNITNSTININQEVQNVPTMPKMEDEGGLVDENSTVIDVKAASNEDAIPVLHFPDTSLKKPLQIENYMSSSTASAVNVLLNVSRDNDQVTKVISNDPPEDLFEDDIRDTSNTNSCAETSRDTKINILQLNSCADCDKSNIFVKEDNGDIIQEEITQTDSKLKDSLHNKVEDNQIKEVEKSGINMSDTVENVHSENLSVNNDHSFSNIVQELPLECSIDDKKFLGKNVPNSDPNNDKHLALEQKTNQNAHSISSGIDDQITAHHQHDIINFEIEKKSLHESNIITTIEGDNRPVYKHSNNSDIENKLTSLQECNLNIDVINEKILAPEPSLRGKDNAKISPSENVLKVDTPNEIESLQRSYLNFDADDGMKTENESTDKKSPSDCDLQIAEALINLPSTAIKHTRSDIESYMIVEPNLHKLQTNILNEDQTKLIDETNLDSNVEKVNETIETCEVNDSENFSLFTEQQDAKLDSSDIELTNSLQNSRFETEQEKSENLNAAQSLVQMSESIDHNINMIEGTILKDDNVATINNIINARSSGPEDSIENKVASLSCDNANDVALTRTAKFETTSSNLLRMLEEPVHTPKMHPKKSMSKQMIVSGKEKILNFEVAESFSKDKPCPKQKIIVRRSIHTKNLMNSLHDNQVSASETRLSHESKLNKDNFSQVPTCTVTSKPETLTELNASAVSQKFKNISKLVPKGTQQIAFVSSTDEKKPHTHNTISSNMFDINSMPVVFSDDILTPESIEKMPILMSDGNFTSNSTKTSKIQPKDIRKDEKITVSSKPDIKSGQKISNMKTLVMNATIDSSNKPSTPNIISKSSKARNTKPLFVIDKGTGKQKIIMTTNETIIKDINQISSKPQTGPAQPAPQTSKKAEKFIILPSSGSPCPGGRTQKIVIDPQTRKAHVLLTKNSEGSQNMTENKPVSAKLIPSISDTANPGSTVMIITNAQGSQSRIVLTPEHERILFPNKQKTNVSQLKTVTHRITTNSVPQKNITSKSPKPLSKQKQSAVITSKGQLIVGGKIATTSQNITPTSEIRLAPQKRILAVEPKKIVQTIQKKSNEPLILLQQKSGVVMQLTAAQFEHLQKTGQIVQKTPVPENKIIVQSLPVPASESVVASVHKQRVRKQPTVSPTPSKKSKPEFSKSSLTSLLTPIVTSVSAQVPTSPLVSFSNSIPKPTTASVQVPASNSSNYSNLDNFEELLPSTHIVRQTEIVPSTHVILQSEPIVSTHIVDQPESTTHLSHIVRQQEPLSLTQIMHQHEPTSNYVVRQNEPEVMQQVIVQPQPEVTTAEPQTQLSDGQIIAAVPGEHFGGPSGTFYLCLEDSGSYTPIDNRPLILENNQLVPVAMESVPMLAPQPERRDILEAALANSDVFHADSPRDDGLDFRDLNANVSVHCRVAETSTTLHQPIMTPVEVPTKADSEPSVPSSLEDGLAVIGVTPHTVPTSLELPITVTDPRIAPKTTDPLSGANYGTTLLTSPNTEMTFVATEETQRIGPISMPILTDEESVGKSMPILTDEVLAERIASSVCSTIESVSSVDVRESENEDGNSSGQWSRGLLTPNSDMSEGSAEIPIQPSIQLSVSDLTRSN